MKINLNNKNSEIFEKVPKEYRELIINSILTKSFQNGSVIKEMNFYMSNSEIEEIINDFNIDNITIKKESRYYSKNKKQMKIKKEIDNEKKDIENLFTGFD